MNEQAQHEDDVWFEEETFQADGENPSKHYEKHLSELNYRRLQETFENLGMKEGTAETMDASRQIHFEQGLCDGIKEGIIVGFLNGVSKLVHPEGHTDFSACHLWSQEKMDQVRAIVMNKDTTLDCVDEEVERVKELVKNHGDMIEMMTKLF